jgi:uncharacterized protein (UPF0276 family)
MKSVLGLNIVLENPSDSLHRRPEFKIYFIAEELQGVNIEALYRDVRNVCITARSVSRFQHLMQSG